MATYQITKVSTHYAAGSSHEHIHAVELSNRTDQRFRKETIIRDLRSPSGDRYYTLGGGKRAIVVVRGCPLCYDRDYLTTLPDETTENNLLSLPRF